GVAMPAKRLDGRWISLSRAAGGGRRSHIRRGDRRLTQMPPQGPTMTKNSSRPVGRHFLHIPGPSPLPDRILRAMDTPIIDHRGPEFQALAQRVLEGVKTIFKTTNPVIIYTA